MGIDALHPPIAPLRQVVTRLEQASVTAALGGSGLLHARGLHDRVNDWDLTTDACPDEVAPALEGLDWEDRTSPERFATACRFAIRLDGVAIDLMSRFAVPVEGAVCRLPTLVSGQWQGLPLGSLEVWAAAYWLMGRTEKAELCLDHLNRTGADPASLERILREPLPAALRERMRTLPRRM